MTERDYLKEAGAIHRRDTILLPERAHLAALITEIGGALNEAINVLIDYEDSGMLDEPSTAILERARVVWHRMEGIDYPPSQIPPGWLVPVADKERSDKERAALDAIAGLLDRHEWTPDTIDQIAGLVRSTGRTVGEPSDEEIALAMEAHRANDPHCTCNDCIEWAAREQREGGEQ